jgi:hypothetical protein
MDKADRLVLGVFLNLGIVGLIAGSYKGYCNSRSIPLSSIEDSAAIIAPISLGGLSFGGLAAAILTEHIGKDAMNTEKNSENPDKSSAKAANLENILKGTIVGSIIGAGLGAAATGAGYGFGYLAGKLIG